MFPFPWWGLVRSTCEIVSVSRFRTLFATLKDRAECVKDHTRNAKNPTKTCPQCLPFRWPVLASTFACLRNFARCASYFSRYFAFPLGLAVDHASRFEDSCQKRTG